MHVFNSFFYIKKLHPHQIMTHILCRPEVGKAGFPWTLPTGNAIPCRHHFLQHTASEGRKILWSPCSSPETLVVAVLARLDTLFSSTATLQIM